MFSLLENVYIIMKSVFYAVCHFSVYLPFFKKMRKRGINLRVKCGVTLVTRSDQDERWTHQDAVRERLTESKVTVMISAACWFVFCVVVTAVDSGRAVTMTMSRVALMHQPLIYRLFLEMRSCFKVGNLDTSLRLHVRSWYKLYHSQPMGYTAETIQLTLGMEQFRITSLNLSK
jgi:hypothetical protein